MEFSLEDERPEDMSAYEGNYFVADIWRRRIDLFAVSIGGHGMEKSCAMDPGIFGIFMEELIRVVLDAWEN